MGIYAICCNLQFYAIHEFILPSLGCKNFRSDKRIVFCNSVDRLGYSVQSPMSMTKIALHDLFLNSIKSNIQTSPSPIGCQFLIGQYSLLRPHKLLHINHINLSKPNISTEYFHPGDKLRPIRRTASEHVTDAM